MLTDTVLKRKGFDVLTEALGLVNAERFISLVLREPFDYTEWQRNLFGDVSADDFFRDLETFKKNNRKT